MGSKIPCKKCGNELRVIKIKNTSEEVFYCKKCKLYWPKPTEYNKQTAREKKVFESGLKQGYEGAKEDDSQFVRHTARKIDEILEYGISPFDKYLLIKYYMNDWREK